MKNVSLTFATALGTLTLALMGCAADPAPNESISGSADEIVNGKATTARPGVGQIVAWKNIADEKSASADCTGTLVGKHTVLTAAHCAASYLTWVRKFYMDMPDGTTKKAGVIKMQMAPGYVHSEKITNASLAQSDVAVFTLDADMDVAPTPISAVSPMAASFATLTGYGHVARGVAGDGGKRETRNIINAVLANYLKFVPIGKLYGLSCNGDSGGPALVARTYIGSDGQEVRGDVIAGVTSFGDCATDSFYARTDILVKWIQEASGGDVVIAQ
jgi:secreted trypsin-like serine protease